MELSCGACGVCTGRENVPGSMAYDAVLGALQVDKSGNGRHWDTESL